MDNKEFGKLFNSLCEKTNKPDAQIAEKLGVDRATIGRWRKGERTPNLSLLPQIAKYFGISLDVFTEDYYNDSVKTYIDNNVTKLNIDFTTMKHKVPVYGRIPAGIPFEAIQERLGDVEIPDKIAKKKDLFGLKIIGNSMNKVIPDGAIGVFQRCCEVNPKDVAVVMVNGDDATVKHFYRLQNGCLLEPDSYDENFVPKIIRDTDGVEVSVIGKLVWYCMDVD